MFVRKFLIIGFDEATTWMPVRALIICKSKGDRFMYIIFEYLMLTEND